MYFCAANVCLWPLADIETAPMNVCFEDMNRLADDLACAAATHSLTDTKADSRRDRDGPKAASRTLYWFAFAVITH